MPQRVAVGVVTGDKTKKTRRVEIARLVKAPKYGKYVRHRTICYVHDENEESHLGDTVEIRESRPLSRTKRWRLVRIVAKSRLAGVAGAELLAEKELAEQEQKPAEEGTLP